MCVRRHVCVCVCGGTCRCVRTTEGMSEYCVVFGYCVGVWVLCKCVGEGYCVCVDTMYVRQ